MRNLVTRALFPVLVVTLLLAGCLKPLVTGHPLGTTEAGGALNAQSSVAPLMGQVEHHTYQTQGATIGDIAVGSTVSIIDTTTNQTLNTTVTDANGVFQIRFSPGFQPSDKIYYLEAYKGLPVAGVPNRAGVSMARVRTLIRYENAKWRHLHTTENVKISASSTALSIITSLRSASDSARVDPTTLLGSLTPGISTDTFTSGSSGVDNSEFTTVRGQVVLCLDRDQDPLYRITYDLSTGAYFLLNKGIDISRVFPLKGPIGTPVTIEGSNLGSNPIVRFNGARANVSVNSVASLITTSVPIGATSGPVTVQIGDIVYNSAPFAVSPWDGHNVFDAAGNMYVSSSRDNRIYRFAPDGTVNLYVKDGLLNYPRGLVVDPSGTLYVANWGADNILKIDPNTKEMTLFASGGGLNDPAGLAMNAQGDLFISNYTGNNILTVATGSAPNATPQPYATSADFRNPFGLAFDSQGYLYASNWNGGTISKIAPNGTVTGFASGLSNPGTLAFDSSDNLYVPCYGTHNVFKITPQGAYSIFTSISHYPAWAAMHTNGTLYVGSDRYNFVARVDPQGRLTDYYSSGHLTWSIKANPANNDLFVASGWGWGNRTKAVYRMSYDAGATDLGNYQPPVPVIKGLPNPSALDYVDASTMYVGDWGGLIFRANPTTGTYNTYAANLGNIGDLTHDSAGTLYAASWSNHGVYQFADNALLKRHGFFWNLSNAVFGPDGYLYVPDYWQGKILRVSPAGVITTYSDNGGAGFSNPHGVAFDTAGNLYVASWGRDRIFKVATGSLQVTDYATGLSDPTGLAFDNAGTLFVSNYSDSTIKKIPSAGTVQPFAIGLNNPRGLAINPADGTLYAPAWNGTVYKITSAGAVSPYATGLGNCMQAYLDNDGSLLVASYGNRTIYVIPPGGGTPTKSYGLPIRIGGVVKDGAGNMYALTWDAPNIYRFSGGSSSYTLWASGPRTPAGLALDPAQKNLYVADFDNGVVNKVDLTTGAISIAANSVHWFGASDELKGLAFGPDGKLYVAVWGNGVYQLDTTLINSSNNLGAVRYGNNSSANGILGGIAFGANGNLYGTTYDWGYYGSAPVTVFPAGGGSGVPLRNFPSRMGF